MKKKQADFIAAALKFTDINFSVQENYSGRGMYGEETIAVVVSCSEIELVGYLVEQVKHSQEDTPDMFNLRSDQMGRDSIVIY